MTKVTLERRRPRAVRSSVRRNGQMGIIADGAAHEVFNRLGVAESEIGTLREQFSAFSVKMDSQGTQLNHIENQLSAIVNSVQARSVTDWKSLAAWAGVILTVVALYTNLNLTPLRESIGEGKADRVDMRQEMRTISAAQNQTVTSLIDAAERRGRAIERMDNIEERLENIEQPRR